MPLTNKQPKKWWTNRQTNKQTDKPNTLPLLRMRAHGVTNARKETNSYLVETIF